MSSWIDYFFTMQADFAFERSDLDRGLILGAVDSIGAYVQHVYSNPLTLVVGDGFSTWGLPKGGDTGFIESAARLGFLFYSISVCGVIALMLRALRQIKELSVTPVLPDTVIDSRRILRFSICVVMLVMICDLHYSIWTAKPVLPFFFFAVAMFERYIRMPRRISFLGV